jgi:hypothetical protein
MAEKNTYTKAAGAAWFVSCCLILAYAYVANGTLAAIGWAIALSLFTTWALAVAAVEDEKRKRRR